MEFMHSRILWQILLSVASLVCLVTAISWIRATYAMYRTGEARPLLLPFPAFMMLDISTVLMRVINRNRLPPNMEAGLEKMRLESIITGNYVKAFMLLMFSLIAGVLVFQIRR
jgi:hypothetical protein